MEPVVKGYQDYDRAGTQIIYQQGPNGELIPMIVQPASPPENPQVNPQPQAPMMPQAQPGQAPMPQPQVSAVPGQPPTVQGSLPQPPQMGQMQGGAENAFNVPPTQQPMAPPPGGSPFTSGLPPELESSMNAGPAKSPEEAASRKLEWTKLATTVQSNPQLMATLFRLGTNLMQPVQPGQTPVGHLGMAMQDSQNYLQSLRAQEGKSAEQQAQIALTKAQTETEKGKPAVQTATVGQVTAETTKTNEEVTTMQQSRKTHIAKLQAEIDSLVANKEVDQARGKILRAQAEKEPQKILEEIELMKAHAWYYRNPGASARATASAALQARNALAEAFVNGGDDELTKLYQTNPKQAMAKAEVKAAAGATGAYWQNREEEQEAADNYEMYSTMYDTLKAEGSKQVKGMTKTAWIAEQFLTSGLPPRVISKIPKNMKAAQPGEAPNRANPGGRPSLNTFER